MGEPEKVHQDILLGILELCDHPVSPGTVSINFAVDEQAVAKHFARLESLGYVERVGDEHYEISPEGEDRVLRRSPAD